MITAQSEKKECILVVDDSEDNLYLMQFILESQGYKVSLADNGQDALSKIERCHPDLILLDVMMPRMNGYEVVNQLRIDENLSSIPVYFITADKYFRWCKAIAAGADGIIYKPINIEELLQIVKQSLKSVDDSATNRR